jgi:hypothetical protein
MLYDNKEAMDLVKSKYLSELPKDIASLVVVENNIPLKRLGTRPK